jgi:hypothetical protein
LRRQDGGKARNVAERPKRVEPEERAGDSQHGGQRRNERGLTRFVRLQRIEPFEQFHQREYRERPKQRPKHCERLRIRRDGCPRDFSERHEDGVAGRVRLVLCRVELVEAQREVQRIDVFQRRREKRQMRDQEDACERHAEAPRRSAVGAKAGGQT